MAFFIEVLMIGLVLSIDSFTAACAMGLRPFTRQEAWRFAISSGGAEALVAFLGAFFGQKMVTYLGGADHYVAFFLLLAIAIHMAYEGLKKEDEDHERKAPAEFHSYFKILLVSLATSLDSLAVGVGLGVQKRPLFPFIFSIGLWALVMTLLGLYLAKILSKKLGPLIHVLGAVILAIMAFLFLE